MSNAVTVIEQPANTVLVSTAIESINAVQVKDYISRAFSAQTSVNILHNFGAYPLVQVLNSSNVVEAPLAITHNTVNDFTVTFSAPFTGTILGNVGSLPLPVYVVTAVDYSILTTDMFIKVTAPGKTITLPTAIGVTGREYFVDNASSGDITLDTTSSQTIQGDLTQIITTQSSFLVVSDGTNWRIN